MRNSAHLFNKEFPNGWGVDVKFLPEGYGHIYSTNYQYSVMTYKCDEGFSSFENIEKPSDVFKHIAEVQKW